MFIATFAQVNSNKFTADKNGEMPFIGKLIAGKSSATLINGSVFKHSNYEPNKLYACQNVTADVTLADGSVKTVTNCEIICTVSVTELPALVKELGAAHFIAAVAVEENADAIGIEA